MIDRMTKKSWSLVLILQGKRTRVVERVVDETGVLVVKK